MSGRSTSHLRRILSVALVALALVPLLVRGHVHRDADALSAPCSACFVAHHAAGKPAAPASLVFALAPALAEPAQATTPSLARPRATNGVRAPPRSSSRAA